MSDDVSLPGSQRVPEALVEPPQQRRPGLVWLIPIVAAAVGLWIGVKTYLEQGPKITISFATAEGIEAGKTRIKFKDVDLGLVSAVELAEDRASVRVTAELSPQAGPGFTAEDTRFWVVRPRVVAGSVSGLGTLLSGSFIGVDPGQAEAQRSEFVGLEKPPVITADVPGRSYRLVAADLGSVEVGTTIYFRRVAVGQVTSTQLAADGKGVHFDIFVLAPYEAFVTVESRFWHASGVDLSIDAAGLRLRTQSAVSVLLGGLAFETPPNVVAAQADANHQFTLFSDRTEAMQRVDGKGTDYVLHFEESVRGLQVGAPVDFRGVDLGEVTRIGVTYDVKTQTIRNRVDIRLYADRLRSRQIGRNLATDDQGRARVTMASLVERGYRAQLRSGNVVTGQLYVAIDRMAGEPKGKLDTSVDPPEMPTVRGTFAEVQQSISSIVKKLDQFPIEALGSELRTALAELKQLLQSTDRTVRRVDGEVLPELRAVIDKARGTLETADQALAADAPLQSDLRQTLRDVSRATEAVRRLADGLERHPDSLIRGKPEPTP